MLKTVGVIIVAIAAITAGFKKSVSLKEKNEFLRQMSQFARYSGEQIRFFRTDTSAIIASGIKKFPLLRFLENGKTSFRTFGFSKEVSEFMEMLGTSDTEGQINLCERYRVYFEGEFSKSSVTCESQGKAYKMLGALGSAAVIILFL